MRRSIAALAALCLVCVVATGCTGGAIKPFGDPCCRPCAPPCPTPCPPPPYTCATTPPCDGWAILVWNYANLHGWNDVASLAQQCCSGNHPVCGGGAPRHYQGLKRAAEMVQQAINSGAVADRQAIYNEMNHPYP
jgi:hypothetical protein